VSKIVITTTTSLFVVVLMIVELTFDNVVLGVISILEDVSVLLDVGVVCGVPFGDVVGLGEDCDG
jgi:ABC-type anion transport system duplicated permease subunit